MPETDGETEEISRRLPRPRKIEGAKCEKCSSEEVTPLPTFSVGSGTAFRATASDVICLRCGHIALPVL
ncbi:MAG: hypothetical protein NT023_17410 [Armatimonadetes bacterium]|nr:hypothetical protein [Armatimonadota bacterium]